MRNGRNNRYGAGVGKRAARNVVGHGAGDIRRAGCDARYFTVAIHCSDGGVVT